MYKPHIIFLSETKAKGCKLQTIKKRLNYDDLYVVDCNGKLGGLCLFWKKNVNTQVLYSDCNVIHAYVAYMNTNIGFYYSFVYGNPIVQQRKILWEKLKRLYTNNHEPWICAGDFNNLLHHSDKMGSNRQHNGPNYLGSQSTHHQFDP